MGGGPAQRPPATLVYLYGPPASGKLTIAQHLAALTGARLFHNHLTVDAIAPVLHFGSPAFTEVLHRLRLDVLATAARTGVDVIFTNNSAWGGPEPRRRFAAFARRAAEVVAGNGGRTVFVQVVAPPSVLEDRVANTSRQAHGKLVDVQHLRELLEVHDPDPLHPGDLVLDTERLPPDRAAREIARRI